MSQVHTPLRRNRSSPSKNWGKNQSGPQTSSISVLILLNLASTLPFRLTPRSTTECSESQISPPRRLRTFFGVYVAGSVPNKERKVRFLRYFGLRLGTLVASKSPFYGIYFCKIFPQTIFILLYILDFWDAAAEATVEERKGKKFSLPVSAHVPTKKL